MPVRFGARRGLLHHPGQYVVLAFVGLSLAGSALLSLPFATTEGRSAGYLTALFTSTSASCVTGLVVVDTETHWSGFGHVVILALIQLGGLGIMTLTSLLVLALNRRLTLRQRTMAASTAGAMTYGDLRTLIAGVLRTTVVIELTVALIVGLRFWATHGEPPGRAAFLGLFHAVSAFNNAGFSLFSDNLAGFRDDPLLLHTLGAAIVIGGIGYPVWRQVLAEPRRPRRWDVHTKVTVSTSLVLIVVGAALFTWFEWSNAKTLGSSSAFESMSNGLFHSVSTRTAGFQTLDLGATNESSHLLTIVLMFIGGGSGSTAGGIKVGTFALLGYVMWTEVRGEQDVVVFGRRIPHDLQRQALTMALMAIGIATAATMALLALTELELADVAFETVSALGTVGLSTGITHLLSGPGQVLVVLLMIIGRVGPPTLVAALVLRTRERQYRPAEERITIG